MRELLTGGGEVREVGIFHQEVEGIPHTNIVLEDGSPLIFDENLEMCWKGN